MMKGKKEVKKMKDKEIGDKNERQKEWNKHDEKEKEKIKMKKKEIMK